LLDTELTFKTWSDLVFSMRVNLTDTAKHIKQLIQNARGTAYCVLSASLVRSPVAQS
jgi:hypothetical protein